MDEYREFIDKGFTRVWRQPHGEDGEVVEVKWSKPSGKKTRVVYSGLGCECPKEWSENLEPGDVVLNRGITLLDGLSSRAFEFGPANSPVKPILKQRWQLVSPERIKILRMPGNKKKKPRKEFLESALGRLDESQRHTEEDGDTWFLSRGCSSFSETKSREVLVGVPWEWIAEARGHCFKSSDQAQGVGKTIYKQKPPLLRKEWQVFREGSVAEISQKSSEPLPLQIGDRILEFRRIFDLGSDWKFTVTENHVPIPQAIWDKWVRKGSVVPPKSTEEWLKNPLPPGWKAPSIEQYLDELKANLACSGSWPLYETVTSDEGLTEQSTMHPAAFAQMRTLSAIEEVGKKLEEREADCQGYSAFRQGLGLGLSLLMDFRDFDRIVAMPTTKQGHVMNSPAAAKQTRDRDQTKNLFAWLKETIKSMPAKNRRPGHVLAHLTRILSVLDKKGEGPLNIGGVAGEYLRHDQDKKCAKWKTIQNWLSHSGKLGDLLN